MNCTQQATLKLWIDKHTPQEVEKASRNLTISELALFHTLNGGTPPNMLLISDRQFQTLMDHLNGVKKPSFFARIERTKREFFYSKVEQPDPDKELDKIAARHEKAKTLFYDQELSRLKKQFATSGPSIQLGNTLRNFIETLSRFPKSAVQELLNGYKTLLKTNDEVLEANGPDILEFEKQLPDFPMWNRRVETEEANVVLLGDLRNELERILNFQHRGLFVAMDYQRAHYFENPAQREYNFNKIYDFSTSMMAVAIEGMQVLIQKVDEQYHARFPGVDFSDVSVGRPPGIKIEGDIPFGTLINENKVPLDLP